MTRRDAITPPDPEMLGRRESRVLAQRELRDGMTTNPMTWRVIPETMPDFDALTEQAIRSAG